MKTPRPKIKIDQVLKPLESILLKETGSSIRKVNQIIDLADLSIKFKVSSKPKALEDMGGVGGYCSSKNEVNITIDINHKSLKKNLKRKIRESLIHELHHAGRYQADIKFDKNTFRECLISEGLADLFVYEITGNKPRWIKKLNQAETKRLIPMIKKDFDKKLTATLYKKWFIIGSRKNKIPRWTGYYVGYMAVKRFRKENPTLSQKELIKLSAKDINTNNQKVNIIYSKFLGKIVKAKIDRPLNSLHPKHGFKYEANYGFVPNTKAPDGEEIDVYVLGVDKPIKEFKGRCIAIIHRLNDNDDKLIVVPDGLELNDKEIKKHTNFQEKYFKSKSIRV